MKILPGTVILLLVCGCGFHLRGTQGTDVMLSRIHVSAVNAYGTFVQELERSLERADVTVTEDRADAPWSLQVLGERITRRAVATTSQIRVSEYEIRMEVDFELTGPGDETLIAPTQLVAERIYSFDSSSLVGNSEEEELLKEEMRRDLVQQMIRRVDATVRSRQEATP